VGGGGGGGRFYIRGEDESAVVRNLSRQTMVWMAVGAAIFTGGFVYLVRVAGAG
jgi:hypothetical protein